MTEDNSVRKNSEREGKTASSRPVYCHGDRASLLYSSKWHWGDVGLGDGNDEGGHSPLHNVTTLCAVSHSHPGQHLQVTLPAFLHSEKMSPRQGRNRRA